MLIQKASAVWPLRVRPLASGDGARNHHGHGLLPLVDEALNCEYGRLGI